MKIGFTGDVFLGGDLLNTNCVDLVSSKIFNSAEYRIINLEQPISNNNYVADKGTLYTDTAALNKLKDLKIDAVNIANNHIHDKGLNGIQETVEHLSSIDIDSFGAGKNISISAKPHFITDRIAILGYCDFDKPYLKKVVAADSSTPGVNPLRLEKIKSDLDNLPAEVKAIIYFHWGMEHVWLPRKEDINIAKELLEDSRIITVIGMHAHRIQGAINHAGKKAYMCLGNFIFPNFYIKPPMQLSYPNKEEIEKCQHQTRQYHKVYKLTLKKWRWVNRVSLVLDFCSETFELNHNFVIQDDNSSVIRDLKGVSLYIFKFWFYCLSMTYRFSNFLYNPLMRLHYFQVRFSWQFRIRWFYLKQLGIRAFGVEAIEYIKRKFKT